MSNFNKAQFKQFLDKTIGMLAIQFQEYLDKCGDVNDPQTQLIKKRYKGFIAESKKHEEIANSILEAFNPIYTRLQEVENRLTEIEKKLLPPEPAEPSPGGNA